MSIKKLIETVDPLGKLQPWKLTWPVLPLVGLYLISLFNFLIFFGSGPALDIEFSRQTWIALTGSDDLHVIAPRFGHLFTNGAGQSLRLMGILLFFVLAWLTGWSGDFLALSSKKLGSPRKFATWFAIAGCSLVCLLLAKTAHVAHQLIVGSPMPLGYLAERNTLLYANLPTVLYFVGGLVIAPISEEVIFRGWLQRLIWNRRGFWTAVIIQAVVFGICHYSQGAYGVLLTGVAGLLLGCVYLLFGKLWPCIVCHALINLLGDSGNIHWLLSGRPQ